MSTVLEAPLTTWTATDLARRFGAMPLWRFCFDPAPGEATEEDVDRLETQHDLHCELVDGVLVKKTMGSYESLLGIRVATLLNLFVLPKKLGWVLGEAGMLRLWPGRVRIPDVSFISRTQTPDGRFPREQPIADLHPDLAVEILSNANTSEEMTEKRHDYFQSGARLVWIIDSVKKIAEINTAADQWTEIALDGVLTGEPVLAGLAIPLKTVFDVDGAM